MKVNHKIWRITSVCAAAALVFMVSMFPITVSADSVEDFNLSLSYYVQQMPSQRIPVSLSLDIVNKSAYLTAHPPVDDVAMDYGTLLKFSATIVNSTNSVIIKAGETFDISISGIHLCVGVNDSGFVWKQTPSTMYFQVYYNDGTFTCINDLNFTYSSLTENQAITCNSVAQKDIYRIVFYEEIPQYSVTSMHGEYPVDIWMGDSVTPTYIKVDIQSKEAGLLGDIDNKLDQLPDQIGDEFESVIDQEKEESKQEGNKFVDQVLDKLPDPSQGVLSALGELTSAVGYTGTEAVIPFPAIVIPGIDGLFDEIVIYDGSDFDLGSCISYIPENILTVIQSLFTIAIVLYCVYELKGIISFIFTLKEKNNG